jgi:hypothetical protein
MIVSQSDVDALEYSLIIEEKVGSITGECTGIVASLREVVPTLLKDWTAI